VYNRRKKVNVRAAEAVFISRVGFFPTRSYWTEEMTQLALTGRATILSFLNSNFVVHAILLFNRI